MRKQVFPFGGFTAGNIVLVRQVGHTAADLVTEERTYHRRQRGRAFGRVEAFFGIGGKALHTLVREEHHAAAQDVDTVEDAADRHGGGGAEVQFPGEGSEAHARLIARYAVAGQNHHFRHDRVDLAGHDG